MKRINNYLMKFMTVAVIPLLVVNVFSSRADAIAAVGYSMYQNYQQNPAGTAAGLKIAAAAAASSAVGGLGVVSLPLTHYLWPQFFGAIAVASTWALGLGVIILDEEAQDFRFRPLAVTNASIIGLSSQELQLFNSQVDLINAMTSEVATQLNAKLAEGQSDEFIAQMAMSSWRNLFQSLSLEQSQKEKLFDAFSKVSAHLGHELITLAQTKR